LRGGGLPKKGFDFLLYYKNTTTLAVEQSNFLEITNNELYTFLAALFDYGYINIRCDKGKLGRWRNSFFRLDQLEGYEIPQERNVYFGVYARGRRSGNADAATTTGVLWADYDNTTLEPVREKIRLAGLPEPSIYVNSGHGIHAYWLLEERAGSEAIPVVKAIVKATGADPIPANMAGLMRLPGSMNVKRLPYVPCYVIEANYSNRYAISTFERLLNVTREPAKPTGRPLITPLRPQTKKDIPELLNASMGCIKAIAQGVQEGHRNFALGRITKYLQREGYSKEKARRIVKEWNNNNDPPEEEEKLHKDFEDYWHTDYKLLGCCIQKSPELQAILECYCLGAECKLRTSIGKLELSNSISLNNRLFNAFHTLTGNDLIVLGVLNRHFEGLSTNLLMDKLTSPATGKPCMSLKTMRKCLNTLGAMGLVSMIEGNRRLGQPDFYKAIPQGTYGTGYTLVTNGAINGAIDGRITPAQFRLYVLLLRYAFGKGRCHPSLSTLAKELRVEPHTISEQLKALDKADYIKRFRGYEKNRFKLVYRLLV
jgi:hypothetical protein